MALNDYILCDRCQCKLLYDGKDQCTNKTNRQWFKERFGCELKIVCPDCEKAASKDYTGYDGL